MIKLDKWQQDFLDCKGDRVLCTGRQVGKSVICAMDAAETAIDQPNEVTLMIAPTERQAYALFEKTLNYLVLKYPKRIKKGRDKPTQTKINLTNNHKIFCLPTGISGIGIRFLTIKNLYADEASRIPNEVWTAVTPMLLTTGGKSTYLSTPAGAEGYFADVVENRAGAFNSFTRFTVSSEEVINNREICETWTLIQKEKALDYLARERLRLSKLQYAQEYLGQIVADLKQFFPNELIRSVQNLLRGNTPLNPPFLSSNPLGDFYLGVDIARMGEDDTVLFTLEKKNNRRLEQKEMEITRKAYLTETITRIKAADMKYNYRKIYIDDGGMGVGVFDPLLMDEQTRRKVVAINNASRPIDKETGKRKILKEDLYNNLRVLMEQGKISLFEKDDEVFLSLSSVQAEYDNGRLKIFGSYTHIAEALVRAAWCMRDKSLNIWIC